MSRAGCTVPEKTVLSTLLGLTLLLTAGYAAPVQAENFSCSVPESFCSCDGDKDSADCKAMSRNCSNPNGMVCVGGICWCDMAVKVTPENRLKISHMPNVDVQSLTSTSGGAAPAKPAGTR